MMEQSSITTTTTSKGDDVIVVIVKDDDGNIDNEGDINMTQHTTTNSSTLHTSSSSYYYDNEIHEFILKAKDGHTMISLHTTTTISNNTNTILQLPSPSSLLQSQQPYYYHIQQLDVSNCHLSTLPELIHVYIPNLQILFCSNNHFISIPIHLNQCTQLRIVAFKNNGLQMIPYEYFIPHISIQWMILTNNCISHIPHSIQYATQLQKCMLSGNTISTLPKTISYCKNLELIRLSCNMIQSYDTILPLLSISKLKWIALGNNPFLDTITQSILYNNNTTTTTTTTTSSTNTNNNNHNNIIISIPQSIYDHHTTKVLGHGASGITRSMMIPKSYIVVQQNHNNNVVNHNDTTNEEETITVAIKTFHTNNSSNTNTSSTTTTTTNNKNNNETSKKVVYITSDGTPELERQIALYISTHNQNHNSTTNNNTNHNTLKTMIPSSSSFNPSGFIHVYGPCVFVNDDEKHNDDDDTRWNDIIDNDTNYSLMMEYLHNYSTIAQPPNFYTCTRDVYTISNHPMTTHHNDNNNNNHHDNNDNHDIWTSYQIIHIIDVLLYSLYQLHSIYHICHGDFYGHNILLSLPTPITISSTTDNNNDNTTTETTILLRQVRLSDFGASFVYDPQSIYGEYIQQIEIRSFIVFLQELIDHIILQPIFVDHHSNNNNNDSNINIVEKEQSSNNDGACHTEIQTTCINPTHELVYHLIQYCEQETIISFEQIYQYWQKQQSQTTIINNGSSNILV